MDKDERNQRDRSELNFNRKTKEFISALMDELAELKGQTTVEFLTEFNKKIDEKFNQNTTIHGS